jgi:N-acetylneuraminate synthase
MVKIISEIGINHNGSIELAKQLILLSKVSGCDYVKIQKRNPDVCVPESQKKILRKIIWRFKFGYIAKTLNMHKTLGPS